MTNSVPELNVLDNLLFDFFLFGSLIGILGYFVFTLVKKIMKDVECSRTGKNGKYILDDNGTCVLTSCSTGFVQSQGTCVPIQKENETLASKPGKYVYLTVTDGLTGRYITDFASPIEWMDVSGKNNTAIVSKGRLTIENGMVRGGPGDALRFPVETIGESYTLFYVGKYDGPTKKRIFDGVDNNWLSGWHDGHAGVAHHGAWLTHPNNYPDSENWIVGTDSIGVFRVNGVDLAIHPTIAGSTSQITINDGAFSASDSSHWAMVEILIYNRKLNIYEIEAVESYLHSEYSVPNAGGIISRGTKDNGYFSRGITDNGTDVSSMSYLVRENGTVDMCRALANLDGTIKGFGFRKSTHPSRHLGSCFFYADMDPQTTGEWRIDADFSTHCTDPLAIVENGCKVPK